MLHSLTVSVNERQQMGLARWDLLQLVFQVMEDALRDGDLYLGIEA